MKTYRITTSNHLRLLSSLLLATVIMFLFIFLVLQTSGYIDGMYLIYGIGYCFAFLPTAFLHIEYSIRNKSNIIVINTDEQTICIDTRSAIPFSDIEKITYVMPPVWHRKSLIRLVPFEDYHFAKIKLKSGEDFVFTCLMANRVEDALMQIKGVPVEKKKRLIATTLY